jgi:cyanophycinase-like exopeptidase
MVKVFTPIANDLVPENVRSLITDRNAAKAEKNFSLADKLRNDIEDLGYQINDVPGGITEVMKIGDADLKPKKHFLMLFGSGEIAPTSVDVYRSTFLQLGKRDLTISLITTPAGFQPNVGSVYLEIRDFLLAALPDFNLNIEVVPINTHQEADKPDYIEQIKKSDILFLGPGSPTYGIRQPRGTKALESIIEQVKNRATLILASAATITFSTHALPVYEIYKVGEDLHWVDGLDLYKDIYEPLTVIPHFNNREGGVGLDTSYCYIGKGRATKLLSILPKESKVISIDEHTALVIDLGSKEQSVRGKGGINQLK